jgi:hypothetical protein
MSRRLWLRGGSPARRRCNPSKTSEGSSFLRTRHPIDLLAWDLFSLHGIRKTPKFCEMSLTYRFAAVIALQNLAAKVNTFAKTYAVRLGM